MSCRLNLFCIVYFILISLFSPLSYGDDQQLEAAQYKKTLKQNKEAVKRLEAWKAILRDKHPRSVATLLNEINTFFNQLVYIPEDSLQSTADLWLTPYEFLAAGGGDCEDFAIAKYFTLVTMGIPQEKLRITYVTIPSQNRAHMVLTYYSSPDAEPLVLDNLIEKILPAKQRPDLIPVYSFNGGSVWLNERINKVRPYGKITDLSKWQSLIQRIKEEEEN